MKTNKQGKVRIPKSGFKRSKFDWSHDVNTTFSWGEIQPTQCRMLVPGSKTTLHTQSLLRLAPMVAPTFGRVKYKTFNQFVSLEEIFPNFGPLMSAEPIKRLTGTKVPKFIPFVRLGALSSWVLQGCHGTLYKKEFDNDGNVRYVTYYRAYAGSNADQTWKSDIFNKIGSEFVVEDDPFRSTITLLPDVGSRVVIRLKNFGDGYAKGLGYSSAGQDGPFDIITSMMGINDMCPVAPEHANGTTTATYVHDYQRQVTIEAADYVLEGTFNGVSFALAVELSDFGKRLRKVIQGAGYQIDFTSTANVSLLPLLATYKAYFDIFGLQLYQGWETTSCASVINYITENFSEDCTGFIRVGNPSGLSNEPFKSFIKFFVNELGGMFYTDNVDYVSAHIDKLAISPKADIDGNFITVNGTMAENASLSNNPNIGTNNREVASGLDVAQDPSSVGEGNVGVDGESAGALSWINKVNHTQVDSELLKRLYKWVNRNTILGRKIADLLRAQGLGKYVDECKSNFIGSSDTYVTISDVVSTAWTEKATLGEFGGKGLQYSEDKTLVFENDEFGFWICLATVVPEAGYTQGIDPTLKSITKMQMYSPDFDAVGMEATQKDVIVGTNYVPGDATYLNGYTFGFVPRLSGWKMQHNLVNGDFNRRGLRNTYLPYTLDKQIDVNDVKVITEDRDADTTRVVITARHTGRRIPIAGNVWRYPTKYNWLGNFNRIFLDSGIRDDDELGMTDSFSSFADRIPGFSEYTSDNFLSHAIYDLQCYAPMKPIVESYGLDEDEPDKAGSDFVAKA